MLLLEMSASEIERELRTRWPGAPGMPAVKRKVLDYQMVALWGLAREWDRPGARILEIGTGYGGSGYMMACAAPRAEVISLTIDERGAMAAERLWGSEGLGNARVVRMASWDYLRASEGLWQMIFVDGDHNRIGRDLPWFNRLWEGGLLVCHDYSPAESPRPSTTVYETLNDMMRRLGRPFDVKLIDDEKTGMVGFYRRSGEQWQ